MTGAQCWQLEVDGSADGEKGLGSSYILKIGPEYLLKNEIKDLREKEDP